jgi:hypothetical protein
LKLKLPHPPAPVEFPSLSEVTEVTEVSKLPLRKRRKLVQVDDDSHASGEEEDPHPNLEL